jgi:hypothetical protein
MISAVRIGLCPLTDCSSLAAAAHVRRSTGNEVYPEASGSTSAASRRESRQLVRRIRRRRRTRRCFVRVPDPALAWIRSLQPNSAKISHRGFALPIDLHVGHIHPAGRVLSVTKAASVYWLAGLPVLVHILQVKRAPRHAGGCRIVPVHNKHDCTIGRCDSRHAMVNRGGDLLE